MKCLVLALTILALAACGKSPSSSTGITKSSFSVWTKTTGSETLTYTGKTLGSVTIWDVDPFGCYYQETIGGTDPNNFTVTIVAHHGSGCGTFAVWTFTNDGTTMTRCYNSLTTHLDVCEAFH